MNDMVKITPKNIVDEARDMPWKVAIEPFRVAPRVYYVGNIWVGSFLVDTEEGLAIIDTTVMEDLYLLLESIRKLGFNPMDIRKIFLTHAHMDGPRIKGTDRSGNLSFQRRRGMASPAGSRHARYGI